MKRADQYRDNLLSDFEPRILDAGSGRWWQCLLATQLFWLWLGLSAYWLLRGLLARGNSISLGLPELLNEVGLSLWVAGALLTPGLELLLRRSRQNHAGAGRHSGAAVWQSFAAAQPWLCSAALALALACTVALLPYRPQSVLMLASTGEPIEFNLLLLPLCVVCLVIGGGLAVLMSCSLHAALRRLLGPGLAVWPWLIACLWVHWHVFSGSDLLAVSSRGEFSWIDQVPLSLGQQFTELISVLRSMGSSPPYANETAGWLTMLLGGIIAASSLLLLIAAAGLRPARERSRLLPLLLAAGTLIPLAVLLPGVQRWLSEPEIAAPGDWQSLASWGLAAVWLTYWLAQWPRALDAKAQPAGLPWLMLFWLLPAYWLLLSWPAVLAGHAQQEQVLAQALVALCLLAPGCSLIGFASALSRSWPRWLQAALQLGVLAVLLLPLSGGERSLAQLLLETLPLALVQLDSRPLALLLLGLLAAFHLLAQLMRPRLARRRRAAVQLAPEA